VGVSKLYTASELYTVGELCDRGQAVWPRASYAAVGKLYAAGELCGSGQAWSVWVQLGIRRRCHSGPPQRETEPQNELGDRSHAKDRFSKFETPLIIIAGITGTREVES
jgi:hypothetical protein